MIATIREAHEAYAASLSGFSAAMRRRWPTRSVDELKAAFGGDLASVLDAAYDLESTLVATHTEILGKLQGIDGAALVASILIVEAATAPCSPTSRQRPTSTICSSTEAEALAPAQG